MTHLSLSNNRNDPDWPEHEDPIKIAEVVDYHLRYNSNLSDFLDETEKLSDQVNVILHDAEDDKLGRIKDLYDQKIICHSKWVEDNWETNTQATLTYKLAMECQS